MHVNAASTLSPVEQHELRLCREADRARGWIRLYVLLWFLSQSYALADYALGNLLRIAYGPDAAATTVMIWFLSVPFAIGAGVLSIAAAARLRRRQWLPGLLPWAMTTAEATVILWMYCR